MAAEETAVSEDEQLQGAVWGDRGGQGSREGREQTGRQLDGGQGHAVLGGNRSSSETPGVPGAPLSSRPSSSVPSPPESCVPSHHPPDQAPAPRTCPLSVLPPLAPTLMWKDDRETLGLPVVQRKRSCWSARGSGSGEGFWPGPKGRVPGAPASLLWKAVQVRPT